MRFDDFAGQVLYGDAWRGHDFGGQRVAVLATGRDAARVVPRVALTAASVKVFLEDADWVVPSVSRPLVGLVRVGAGVPVVGPRARRSLARIHLRLAVKDAWTRRLLTPDDRFATRATAASSSFYPAVQGEHCKLIRWPVYAISAHGVRTAEGIEHQVDVIVVVPAPERAAPAPAADVDVLVLGAGVSGIGVACHLAREVPDASFTVLERRHAIGGTWDLFRYPGVRSDSDMYTFGYRFKPWHGTKVLADGESIKAYIEDAADENGVTERIRFGRAVTRASWSTADGIWTVESTNEVTGEVERHTSRFLVLSTGFYRYDAGHRPAFPDEEKFAGEIVHPQHWPEGLDYTGKRVVVIGSGATAVTLVPAMAADAEHVTMLQRSPTYIVPVPSEDPVASILAAARVPAKVIYSLGRARNIALQQAFYKLSRTSPQLSRTLIRGAIRAGVGPGVGMEHFDPAYNPWDERLCVVPNGDLFSVLRRGKATVVTDHIDRFTETGIRLRSGDEIPADLVVAATGFEVQLGGGMEVEVDGTPVSLNERVIYRGLMVDGLPNSMVVLGYTNATWTLKVDLVAERFCRLIRHMDRHGYSQVVAVATADDRAAESVLAGGLRSGYVRRAESELPRQGTRNPWKNLNDYYRDVLMMRRGAIEDSALRFTRDGEASQAGTTPVVSPVRLPA